VRDDQKLYLENDSFRWKLNMGNSWKIGIDWHFVWTFFA
jgi:hypothetical protein